MSVGMTGRRMTGRRMTGRHRRTGTASIIWYMPDGIAYLTTTAVCVLCTCVAYVCVFQMRRISWMGISTGRASFSGGIVGL